MTERPETYHHTADAWTVGRLREALAGLPADMPISLAVPDDGRPAPLGDTFDDDWVITDTEFLVKQWGGERGDEVDRHLTLVVDRPTGAWELREGERMPGTR
ncbi:DUF6225 family protein [Kitasatospora sp. NPDC093679]|uniref:DUF6225 family protein n=1 Tax=Kitasatospora sp. NPDC093679 TaxID=3154983 RepID=UPI0034237F57